MAIKDESVKSSLLRGRSDTEQKVKAADPVDVLFDDPRFERAVLRALKRAADRGVMRLP